MNKKEKKSVTKSQTSEILDCVFIGTSPISVFEAAFQASTGKSILMIDSNDQIGGAWIDINIFGLHNVENAVHYFNDYPIAFDFMKKMNWDIVKSKKKYRVFEKPFLGISKMPYDNVVSRLISNLHENSKEHLLNKFFLSLKLILNSLFKNSVYIKNGSSEIIKTIKLLIKKFKIKILLETKINNIKILNKKGIIILQVNKKFDSSFKSIKCRKLFMSHGTKIKKIIHDKGETKLDNKVFRRPAVHILIRDNSPEKILELIFMKHPLIKYIHDITKYTKEYDQLRGEKKLLVLALKHEIKDYYDLGLDILNICKINGIIGKDSVLEKYKFSEIFLPSLVDQNLKEIEKFHHPFIECLSTINFSRGLAIKSKLWRPIINKN